MRPSNDASRGGGAPAAPRPAVGISALSKRYGGVVALDRMSVEIEAGTVHAFVGENGAGKSTLMKVLAGVVRPDAGTIRLGGEEVALHSPREARERGIGIVYQELSLFPHRSALANLFVLTGEPTRLGVVSRRTMRHRAAPVLERIGLDVDLDVPVDELPMGDRQLIELCRVLLSRPRVLILDEPNSALSERETARLFAVLRQLREQGITILYVSHRLEEVFEIADRITVMRNGRGVLTRERSLLTIPEVIEGMVGVRHEADLFPDAGAGQRVTGRGLVVRDLVVGSRLRGIRFEAAPGDIVGLAGMEGSGAEDLLGVLFGARKADVGEVEFPDGRGLPRSTTAAARRRISFVPADRRRQGLMLEASVARNVAQVSVGALRTRSPVLTRRELAERAVRQIQALRIRTPSPWVPVNQLSGGNQQKVVVGKWLEVAPEVVLLDDPTRGVDVGAKREIYLLVRRLADEGRIVLFRSTELPELIGLCDQILVFYRGRLVDECPRGALDSRELLHAINTGERPAGREGSA